MSWVLCLCCVVLCSNLGRSGRRWTPFFSLLANLFIPSGAAISTKPQQQRHTSQSSSSHLALCATVTRNAHMDTTELHSMRP